MVKSANVLFLIIIWASLSLIACGKQREPESTTSVTIVLPDVYQRGYLLQSKSFQPQNRASIWGIDRPIDVTEFNCFAIMVTWSGAPSTGICTNEDSTVSIPVTLADGFVTSGGTIQMTVPSGTARNFKVVGFKTSAGTCPTLKRISSTDYASLSAPFILAETSVNLSGETQNVTMNASLIRATQLNTCTGTLFNWETAPPIYEVSCSPVAITSSALDFRIVLPFTGMRSSRFEIHVGSDALHAVKACDTSAFYVDLSAFGKATVNAPFSYKCSSATPPSYPYTTGSLPLVLSNAVSANEKIFVKLIDETAPGSPIEYPLRELSIVP